MSEHPGILRHPSDGPRATCPAPSLPFEAGLGERCRLTLSDDRRPRTRKGTKEAEPDVSDLPRSKYGYEVNGSQNEDRLDAEAADRETKGQG